MGGVRLWTASCITKKTMQDLPLDHLHYTLSGGDPSSINRSFPLSSGRALAYPALKSPPTRPNGSTSLMHPQYSPQDCSHWYRHFRDFRRLGSSAGVMT